jgi:hypothetical protein
MRNITSYLVSVSHRWWLVGGILVLNIGSFQLLFALEDRFEAAAGLPVFDTQNDLTPATILEQLPRYGGAARTAYAWFAAYDWVFPLLAALWLAVLWTWLLRTNSLPVARRLERWNLPVWGFAATLFDWLENIALLLIVYGGMTQVSVLEAAIFWKRLKLAGLTASVLVTALLLILAVAGLGYQWWQASRQPKRRAPLVFPTISRTRNNERKQ